jgi:hypothetical protein
MQGLGDSGSALAIGSMSMKDGTGHSGMSASVVGSWPLETGEEALARAEVAGDVDRIEVGAGEVEGACGGDDPWGEAHALEGEGLAAHAEIGPGIGDQRGGDLAA